ncbi:MAG: GNAT family N-acetyltransferase [Gemmatimonadaceae bacterium]
MTAGHVAAASAPYTLLEWDSATFGFPVARLAPDLAGTGQLVGALGAMARHGVRLAYLFASPHERGVRVAAEAAGGRLVDEKLTYAMRLADVGARLAEAEEPRGIAVAEFTGETPSPTLRELARQSGDFSRFRTDPGVPPRVFEAIYDAWIDGSVSKRIAETVLIATDTASATAPTLGMVTLGHKSDRADIGLLAVAAAARGRGVGRALVRAAQRWALARGSVVAQVVTQRANAPACRLYEHCGYHVDRAELVYHFWLATAPR